MHSDKEVALLAQQRARAEAEMYAWVEEAHQQEQERIRDQAERRAQKAKKQKKKKSEKDKKKEEKTKRRGTKKNPSTNLPSPRRPGPERAHFNSSKLYQDFHVELVERTAVPIFDDDSSSESESTSRSSGRRLRQQHAGLEHS